tara:strand:- start:54 stop:1769 length:1716 start_codon:yes stop_codon:yes gene_type:complete
MGAVVEVKYFNSFVLKKTTAEQQPVWNGSLGIPNDLGGYKVVSDVIEPENWAIEEARIRGGYNNTSVDYGAKAYLVEEDESASFRINSLIYSGIFNSRTGINNSNVFSVAEDITKSADPSNGSIQKLYAEDTNLIVFQENKVSRALIDKDAIYSAEGGGSVTSSNLVIGVIQPYAGEYGISKNPESFAVYGYQKYFADKNNNAILRLSSDGITEISGYGMIDFFRDTLISIDNNNTEGYVIGGYDVHNSQYVVSMQRNPVLQPNSTNFSTLSFDETVRGWVSFFTYKPEQIFSLRNVFYSAKDGGLFKHYSRNNIGQTSVPRGTFYGVTSDSSISFVVNQNPGNSKSFQAISYEGSSGWQIGSFKSDRTGEMLTLKGWTDQFNSVTFDETTGIKSYFEGEFVVTDLNVLISLPQLTTTTVQINPSQTNGQVLLIPVGGVVTGIGVPTDTTVVSFDNATNVLTLSQAVVVQQYDYLNISLVVDRPNYFTTYGTTSPSLDRYQAGFNLKENKYVANLVNNSVASEREVNFGNEISGIKGFYANVTISTDATTDPGGEKQLFSVGTTYVFNNGY